MRIKDLFYNINIVLNKNQKILLLYLIFLILIGVFLEVIGLGAVLPFLVILTDKSKIIDYIFFENLKLYILNASNYEVVIFSILLLIVFFLLKNSYLAFLAWIKNKFIFLLVKDLSKKLLTIYLDKPYRFYLENNSSNLIRDINVETKTFCSRYILSLLDIIINVLIILMAIVLITIVEPILSLIIMIMFSVFSIIYYFTIRKKITSYGLSRLFYEGKILILLREIFGNIKLIKLLEKKSFFINSYSAILEGYLNPVVKSAFYNEIPKLFFEVISVILFSVIIIFLFNSNNNFEESLPILGFFIMSMYKILPSVSKILIQFQNIKFSEPVIKLFLNEFKSFKNFNLEKSNSSNFKFDNLEINNLNFSYDKLNYIFKNLNVKFEKEKIYCLVGKSGAGKSTLLDIMMGFQKVDDGNIILNSSLNFDENIKSWQSKIGYVPQNIVLLDDTIKKNIAFGVDEKNINSNQLMKVIENSQMTKYLENLPHGVNTMIGENGSQLSGGQRQRLGIARALYFEPEILLLDEITNSIDEETEKKIIYDLIKLKKEKTIIIITHKIFDKSIFDVIYEVSEKNVKKIN